MLGAAVALALVLGAVACGAGGGLARPPAAVDPISVLFTVSPQNKSVTLLVSRAGEWKVTAITISGPDQAKFIPVKQCLNHVFVVGNAQTKECEEIVSFSGVFEAGKVATLSVSGAGINGSVGNLTLHIPLKS